MANSIAAEPFWASAFMRWKSRFRRGCRVTAGSASSCTPLLEQASLRRSKAGAIAERMVTGAATIASPSWRTTALTEMPDLLRIALPRLAKATASSLFLPTMAADEKGRTPMKKIAAMLQAFRRSSRGNVAMMFALALVPMFIARRCRPGFCPRHAGAPADRRSAGRRRPGGGFVQQRRPGRRPGRGDRNISTPTTPSTRPLSAAPPSRSPASTPKVRLRSAPATPCRRS